jgi:hypothetical protein
MFEAALKKLGIRLSDSISGSNCHRMKPCAWPWDPVTAPLRFRSGCGAVARCGTLHRVKIDLPGIVFTLRHKERCASREALLASFRV